MGVLLVLLVYFRLMLHWINPIFPIFFMLLASSDHVNNELARTDTNSNYPELS
jgi:hypothetical protein